LKVFHDGILLTKEQDIVFSNKNIKNIFNISRRGRYEDIFLTSGDRGNTQTGEEVVNDKIIQALKSTSVC
jgi:hypothetical protein